MSFQAGWRDFLRGKPWPAAFDKWGWVRQVSYEEGRHAAAALKGQGMATPTKLDMHALPSKVYRLVRDEQTMVKQARASCYDKPSSWRTLPNYRSRG